MDNRASINNKVFLIEEIEFAVRDYFNKNGTAKVYLNSGSKSPQVKKVMSVIRDNAIKSVCDNDFLFGEKHKPYLSMSKHFEKHGLYNLENIHDIYKKIYRLEYSQNSVKK